MRKAFFLLLVFAGTSLGQLSPGDLHKSHASLEGLKNCAQCHDAAQKISAAKCLKCHSALKERIDAQKGLHAQKGYDQCEVCHSEHQGRNYDLVYWPEGRERFDHKLAGYELTGKHKELSCEKCHQQKNIVEKQRLLAKNIDLDRTHLGLRQDCLSCHRDEHRSQLSTDCLKCHTMTGWKPASGFDHSRSRYALQGKHQSVACLSCHALIKDNRFGDDADYHKFTGIGFSRCASCHKDIHDNKFGANCEKCHSPGGWQAVSPSAFDHNQSRFPLKGKHAGLECKQCHLPGRGLKIVRFERCVDCHKDYHAGQFTTARESQRCEECHDESGFSPSRFTVKQHLQSRYPLDGAHLAIPCVQCHDKLFAGTQRETVRFKFASLRCAECHKDPHNGEVKKYLAKEGCEYCHAVQEWSAVKFDHQQTRFKLEGKHNEVPCASCHKQIGDGTEKGHLQFAATPGQCSDCHADIHYGQFKNRAAGAGEGQKTLCEKCHTPGGWQASQFIHNRDAAFKLEGAHLKVACEKCHSKITLKGKTFVLYKPVRKECESCHGTNTNRARPGGQP